MKNKEIKPEDKKVKSADIEFKLSKDAFQNYIEITLWNKFQDKLWKIVGIALTVGAIAGIFGIRYYIDNELNKRLSKIEIDFRSKSDQLMKNVKLLNFLAIVQEKKQDEISNQTFRLIEKIEGITNPNIKYWEKEELINSIKSIAYEGKVYKAQRKKIIHPTNELLSEKIYPPDVIQGEHSNVGGSYLTSTSHPIKDGTVNGELEDLKIKLSHLEVFNSIVSNLKEELIVFGSKDELERIQNKVLFNSIIKKKLNDQYDTILNQSLINYFPINRIDEIEKYQHLYKLNLDFNNI
jgi:hypothetical protein